MTFVKPSTPDVAARASTRFGWGVVQSVFDQYSRCCLALSGRDRDCSSATGVFKNQEHWLAYSKGGSRQWCGKLFLLAAAVVLWAHCWEETVLALHASFHTGMRSDASCGELEGWWLLIVVRFRSIMLAVEHAYLLLKSTASSVWVDVYFTVI